MEEVSLHNREQNIEEHKVKENQGMSQDHRMPLFNEDDVVADYLDIKEIDPISSTSFEQLIKEVFKSDKHFYLAKMTTRSNQNFTKTHSHFYFIYGILKIIFKKRGDEIIGRYHTQFPIYAKNPITNTQIIGEVYFYKINNPYIDLSIQEKQKAYQEITLEGIKGFFAGTDFNYLYSDQLRKDVMDNIMEHYRATAALEEFIQPIQHDQHLVIDRNPNDLQSETDIHQIIVKAYHYSQKFFLNGLIACIYFVAAVTTFIMGLTSFFEKKSNQQLLLNPYEFILIFAAIFYEFDLRRITQRQELKPIFVFKFIAWLAFLVLIILTIVLKKQLLFKIMNFSLIIFPCTASLYTIALLRFKYFSIPIDGQIDENGQLEDMVRQRIQANDRRQQQFDEQHFGGEQLVIAELNANLDEQNAQNNQQNALNGQNLINIDNIQRNQNCEP